MITEDYVSFEVAKLLKEKGFNVPHYYCSRVYSDKGTLQGVESVRFNGVKYISAPTLQMAMKWLREKHRITIGTLFEGDRIYYEIHQNNEFVFGVDTPKSYEKVCDEAIKYCLENLI